MARGLTEEEALVGASVLLVPVRGAMETSRLALIMGYTPAPKSEPPSGLGRVIGVLLAGHHEDTVYRYIGPFLKSLGGLYTDLRDEEIMVAFAEFRWRPEDDRSPIPGPGEKRMRTCALNVDLVNHFMIDGGRCSREDVRRWYVADSERLVGTGLGVNSVSVCHVVPECVGGLSHVYNYVLLPNTISDKFRDEFDDEKICYIGPIAVAISTAFAKWASVRSNVDLTRFRVPDIVDPK